MHTGALIANLTGKKNQVKLLIFLQPATHTSFFSMLAAEIEAEKGRGRGEEADVKSKMGKG